MSVTVTATLAGAVAPVVTVENVTFPVCVGFESASAARGVTVTFCDDGHVANDSEAGAALKPVPVVPTVITTGEGVPMVPAQVTATVWAAPPSAKVSEVGAAVKVALVGANALLKVNVGAATTGPSSGGAQSPIGIE